MKRWPAAGSTGAGGGKVHPFRAVPWKQTAVRKEFSSLITVPFESGDRSRLIMFCILCQHMTFI